MASANICVGSQSVTHPMFTPRTGSVAALAAEFASRLCSTLVILGISGGRLASGLAVGIAGIGAEFRVVGTACANNKFDELRQTVSDRSVIAGAPQKNGDKKPNKENLFMALPEAQKLQSTRDPSATELQEFNSSMA